MHDYGNWHYATQENESRVSDFNDPHQVTDRKILSITTLGDYIIWQIERAQKPDYTENVLT